MSKVCLIIAVHTNCECVGWIVKLKDFFFVINKIGRRYFSLEMVQCPNFKKIVQNFTNKKRFINRIYKTYENWKYRRGTKMAAEESFFLPFKFDHISCANVKFNRSDNHSSWLFGTWIPFQWTFLFMYTCAEERARKNIFGRKITSAIRIEMEIII